MARTNKKGFTLIELLVVIAIIALLLSIVMPALNRAKIAAQKVICRSNVKQQALAILLYAEANDSYTPNNDGGYWLWDITFWCTNELSRYAGITDNKVYFCPGNKVKKHDDARFWQFTWAGTSDFSNPLPLRDESALTRNQQQSYYRVPPYIYFFDRYNNEGNSTLRPTLATGQRAQWIRKFSNVRNAGSTLLMMDAVISANNNTNFFKIEGGIFDMNGPYDNSNHASRQQLYAGTNPVGPKPDGANIAYADGHVEWKDFGPPPPNSNIKHQYAEGMWYWW